MAAILAPAFSVPRPTSRSKAMPSMLHTLSTAFDAPCICNSSRAACSATRMMWRHSRSSSWCRVAWQRTASSPSRCSGTAGLRRHTLEQRLAGLVVLLGGLSFGQRSRQLLQLLQRDPGPQEARRVGQAGARAVRARSIAISGPLRESGPTVGRTGRSRATSGRGDQVNRRPRDFADQHQVARAIAPFSLEGPTAWRVSDPSSGRLTAVTSKDPSEDILLFARCRFQDNLSADSTGSGAHEASNDGHRPPVPI